MKFRTSRSEALLQPFHTQLDSRVQEQFAYDCDINNIVSGMTAPLPIREPVSDEVRQFTPDMYEKALYTKAAAESAFMELPSDVRTFFGNDPAKMLSFIGDPANTEKCVELGLMKVNESAKYNAELLQNIKELNTKTNSVGDISVPPKTVETVIPMGSQGV